MTIQELINNGKIAAKNCKKNGDYGEYYIGEEYENWISLSRRYLETNFPHDVDTIRYSKLSEGASGNGNEYFHSLIAILNAFNNLPIVKQQNNIEDIVEKICTNFNKFDRNIRRRHGERNTIEIIDEYDVQDSLYAILKLFVDDIRPEDYVPSYAGANSRVDFLLPEYKTVIETKMTNDNLKDKQVGEQLIIDVSRYKQLHGYDRLICFVYDKNSHISNPYGLKSDLERLSDSDFNVIVYISPL